MRFRSSTRRSAAQDHATVLCACGPTMICAGERGYADVQWQERRQCWHPGPVLVASARTESL
jgi:hypothetical protein